MEVFHRPDAPPDAQPIATHRTELKKAFTPTAQIMHWPHKFWDPPKDSQYIL